MTQNPYEPPQELTRQPARRRPESRPWFWQPFHPLTLMVVGLAILLLCAGIASVAILHSR